jgi:polar amino acid transport system permease protein
MSRYQWDFGAVFNHLDVLLVGFRNTLILFGACLVVSLALGLLCGAAQLSTRRFLRLPVVAYVELFRNTPVLIQLMWLYFAFPILTGVKLSVFAASLGALSLTTGAFFSDVFRGGIQSIHRGQWEGARALGMSYPQLMRRVILPQAIRRMIPPLTNRSVELAKMTTLTSTIAYAELLYQARLLSSATFRPIETLSVVTLFYVVLFYLATLGIERLERRLAQSD